MKTSNLLKTLTSALFLGAALTGVQADSLLRDGDFNALPVSTAPDIGKAAGRWHFDSVWAEAAPSQVSIVPAPAGGDGKCLLMSLAATETVDAEPEVLHQFFAVNRSIDKIINMSFDIYVEPGRGGGDTSIAQGSLGSERVVHLRWNSDGTLYNRVPSGVAPLFPYPRGVWQSVRVELDLYNDRYNLHWSEKGQPVALTRLNLPLRNAGLAYIDRVSVIRFVANPDVRAFYDNFRMTTNPVITPVNVDLAAGGETTLQVVNFPTNDATFQWQLNGTNLDGATAATLELTNVTTDLVGNYTAVITSGGQSVTTEASTVRIFDRLTITAPPQNITAVSGTTSGFSVAATGPLPMTYQWRRNGVNLAGKTTRLLTFSASEAAAGDYAVVVSDANGSAVSQPATLTVLVKPTFVQAPLSQSVVAGGNVTFSAEVTGIGPFTYQWRKGTSFAASTILATVRSGEKTAFRTLSNVQTNAAGTYRLYLGNEAVPTISDTSPNRVWTLTVLPDTDRDGMPDDWETANGLNPNDPTDSPLDSDGDGMSNLAEYRSGTVATDAASALKVESLAQANGQIMVSFTAAANKTYTVEATGQASDGTWDKVADVIARPAERIVTVTDPGAADGARFYRVVTPRRF